MGANREFFKKFLVYGTGTVTQRLVGLLLFPLFTRFLTPEDYGVLSLVSVFCNITIAILCFGIPTSIFRFYLREERGEGRRRVLGACLLLIGLSGLPLLALFGASRPISAWLLDDAGMWFLLILSLVSSYGDLLSKVPLAPMRAAHRAGRFVAVTLGFWWANVLLSVLLVVGLRLGALGVLTAQAGVGSLWFAAAAVLFHRRRFAWPRPGQVRELVRYGLPLVGLAITAVGLNVADRLILKLYRPLAEIGLYSVGYRVGELVLLATMVFNVTWVPFAFDEARRPGGRARMATVGTTWFGLTVLGSTALAVFSREALWVLAPPTFHAAAAVVPPVIIGLGLAAVQPITSIGMQVADRTRYLPMLGAAALLLNVGLNFLWIPEHGIVGAAWATAASFGLRAIGSLVISQRCFLLPIPAGRWAAAGGLALASGTAALRVQALALPWAVTLKVLLCGLLAAGLSALGILRWEPLRRIGAHLRRRGARDSDSLD